MLINVSKRIVERPISQLTAYLQGRRTSGRLCLRADLQNPEKWWSVTSTAFVNTEIATW